MLLSCVLFACLLVIVFFVLLCFMFVVAVFLFLLCCVCPMSCDWRGCVCALLRVLSFCLFARSCYLVVLLLSSFFV